MIAKWLDTDFKEATKDDIYALVGMIERSQKSEWTKHDYKICIKRFYRWLNSGKDLEITSGSKPA